MVNPVVQSTYAERHDYAVEGMLADMVQNNTETRLVETSGGIGFGKAVTRGSADKGVVLGGTVAKFAGVTVADKTLARATPDKFALGDNMPVCNFGMIYVLAAGVSVADGDDVYFNPTTGAFGNAGGAAVVGAGTAVAGNTGNGTVTLDSTAYGAGVKAGTWRAVLIEPVANGGIWSVFDPEGNRVGEAVTGTLFAGPLRFTIADGATDFGAGDEFTFAVTLAAEGPIPGAKWVDTTASGKLGRISLGIMVR
jgi:hypothetical protein